MQYLYYPGCSLKSTGRAYEESLLAVLSALGITVRELDDWNCCGATSYMSVDQAKAFALAARNLALAEEAGPDAQLIAPCAACYLVLNKAQHAMADEPALKQTITGALQAAQLNYTGSTRVRHPLDVLVNDYGLDALAAKATRPLKGLKVACYYGCQIVRPYATLTTSTTPPPWTASSPRWARK
jgi:heterodisulfide reductase subunit B